MTDHENARRKLIPTSTGTLYAITPRSSCASREQPRLDAVNSHNSSFSPPLFSGSALSAGTGRTSADDAHASHPSRVGCLLDQAVEKLASGAGLPSVDTERELIRARGSHLRRRKHAMHMTLRRQAIAADPAIGASCISRREMRLNESTELGRRCAEGMCEANPGNAPFTGFRIASVSNHFLFDCSYFALELNRI